MKNILNIVTQILAYGADSGNTNYPALKHFDWIRSANGILIDEIIQKNHVLLPQEEVDIIDFSFSDVIPNGTTLNLALIDNNIYVLEANANIFRTLRPIAIAPSSCTVTINNNSVVEFTFDNISVTGLQAGDYMRISGYQTFNIPPFAFSELNQGLWIVTKITGNTIQAIRPSGMAFSALSENITNIQASDIIFYAPDNIQPNYWLSINGDFSELSFNNYQIIDVIPSKIYFSSAVPLPNESVVYSGSSSDPKILFVKQFYKFIYLESNKDVSVKFNTENNNQNIIQPISINNNTLVGFLHKSGNFYRVKIKNLSKIDNANIIVFIA